MKAKEFLKGKDLSMHSQTSRIFSCSNYGLKEFNIAELNVLKAEIILCKILGAKELIFHLKQEKLTKKEKEIFKEVLKFAKKNKIELIYESNGYFIGETCLDILKEFPKLGYNLDLGHLNTAIENKTLGLSLDKFISLIKNRVVYIHAHNNRGKDTHESLDKGTLDWQYVLNMLNLSKIKKIILEVRIPKDIAKTKKLLENYLKKK